MSPSALDTIDTRLSRAWMALAIAALGIAALLALLLIVARTPYVGRLLPSADWFRTGLVLHVTFAVTVWLLGFAASRWSGASGAAAQTVGRASFVAAALAFLTLALTPLLMPGPAHLSNYVPLLDSPLFIGALLALVASVCLTYVRFILSSRRGLLHSLPLALSGLPLLAALLSLVWSLRALGTASLLGSWDLMTWGAGHTVQLTYVCMLMLAWLELAHRAGVILPRRVVHLAFMLQALPALAVPVIHSLYSLQDPAFRTAFTEMMRWGAWPGAVLLVVAIALQVRGARVAMRALDPALTLSALTFLLGLAIGASISDDTSVVPAHYHGTVGAITLAFMGVISTHTVRPKRRGLACIEPIAVYAFGLVVLVLALAWSGWHGVPRKSPLLSHPLISLEQQIGMVMMGLGGALAIAGALLFATRWARSGWDELAAALSGWTTRVRDRRALGLTVMLAAIGIGGAVFAMMPRPLVAWVSNPNEAQVSSSFERAVRLMREGRPEQAAISLHEVLVLAPEMPEAHTNMGYCLLALGKPRAAAEFFESATTLRTTQTNAYYGLAIALEALGDMPGALGAMRTYVHLSDETDPFARKAQAAIWEWQAELERARKGASQSAEKRRPRR